VKYVIINADDFGLNKDVNEGVMRAFMTGAVSNTTLMVKRAALREALNFARENRNLSVGLHLDLDDILACVQGDEERFSSDRISKLLASPERLRRLDSEIEEQIRLFKNGGIPLTHIDGHHHLHAHPLIFPLIVKVMIRHNIRTVRIAKIYDLVKYPPIIWPPPFYSRMKALLLKNSIRVTDHFTSGIDFHELKRIRDGVTEIMIHPGVRESWRQKDLETVSSGKWRAEMKTNAVKLISFRDFQSFQ